MAVELNADVVYHLLMQTHPAELNYLGRSLPAFWKVRSGITFRRNYLARWELQLREEKVRVRQVAGWAVLRRAQVFGQCFRHEFEKAITLLFATKDFSTLEWIISTYRSYLSSCPYNWDQVNLTIRLRDLLFKCDLIQPGWWLACEERYQEIARVSISSQYDYTEYLVWLVKNQHFDYMLTWYPKLNHDSSFLFVAIVQSDNLLLAQQVQSSIPLDDLNPNYWLSYAISIPMAQYLIGLGANRFNRPLQQACKRPNLEIVQFLLQQGAIPNTRCLIRASNHHQTSILLYLLTHFEWTEARLIKATRRAKDTPSRRLLDQHRSRS